MAIDGVGWDWSYMANEEDHALVADGEAPIEFALMANTESKKDLSWTGLPEFVDDTVTDYIRPSPTVVSTSTEELEEVKLEKDRLDGKLAGLLKASKNLDHLIESQRSSPTIVSTSTEGQNKDSSTYEDVASPNPPKPFVKVLVNKSQNKTPYELFNGRTPAIVFLKPFGCHVMILNTLDNLGKFKAKGDKGYFIGYSMSSKAFRVFNKRTRRLEENLHVEFLENKSIEKGAGPNWLFDIDSLTKSMNYVPVDAGTNSTNLSGTKDAANQEVKKDVSSLRYIFLPNWAHDDLLEFSSTDQMETLTVESLIPTVSSPALTACLNDSQEPSSKARLISKRVANQEETPSLDNILSLTNRFEDTLGVTTSSDESIRVEADVSNMETSISASPTPTLR
nr:ribonuclease H-like domain-containing protein [Tanacetum cinerariifolium]